MKALTILPGAPDSGRLDEVSEPTAVDGAVLVRTLQVGVCGTDLELMAGRFGRPPAGTDRLILGHEVLGQVLGAPPAAGFSPGDFVAAVVRRPGPAPCEACAAGEWDMCRDGRFTEHGIVGRHGFCVERFRAPPDFLVKVPRGLGASAVLLEPASVVAKAWEQVERIAARSVRRPRTAVVTGAGPIGLLAALFGVQRGFDVTVLDLVTAGPKPALVRDLGATYRSGPATDLPPADIVIECTGAAPVILATLRAAGHGIACLLGGCHERRPLPFDLDGFSNGMIGGNGVVFGSVNSNRRHYEAAVAGLAQADAAWLARLITRRVPLDRWHEALRRGPDDVKAVIEIADPLFGA